MLKGWVWKKTTDKTGKAGRGLIMETPESHTEVFSVCWVVYLQHLKAWDMYIQILVLTLYLCCPAAWMEWKGGGEQCHC